MERRSFLKRSAAGIAAALVGLRLKRRPHRRPAPSTVFVDSAAGRDYGDGETPATAVSSISRAVDLLGAAGGTIYLAAGHYEVKQPLTGLRIIGTNRPMLTWKGAA